VLLSQHDGSGDKEAIFKRWESAVAPLTAGGSPTMSQPLTAHDEPYSVVTGVHAPDLRSTTTVLSVEEKVAISGSSDLSVGS
jgi:hypothetical protein